MAMSIYRVAFSNYSFFITGRSVLATDIILLIVTCLSYFLCIVFQIFIYLNSQRDSLMRQDMLQFNRVIYNWIFFSYYNKIFYEVMNRKIKHDQYQLLVCFKTDNVMSISAEFTPTCEHFANASVQLMRINKDTVFASLERKNQKNLRCEFEQLVQDGKKCLQIIFVVNFDFLPEFREEVRLQYVQLKDSLKHLNLSNMQAEISQIQKAIDSLENNGSTIYLEVATTTINSDKKEIYSRDLNDGKFIIRCSGTINNPTGIAGNDKVNFFIEPPGDKQEHKIEIKTNSQAGYQFPFFFSDVVKSTQGQLKVKMSSSIANATVMNLHFVVNRVVQVN